MYLLFIATDEELVKFDENPFQTSISSTTTSTSDEEGSNIESCTMIIFECNRFVNIKFKIILLLYYCFR